MKRARTAILERLQEPEAEVVVSPSTMDTEDLTEVVVGARDQPDRSAEARPHAGQADAALLLSLAQEPPGAAAVPLLDAQVQASRACRKHRDAWAAQLQAAPMWGSSLFAMY